MRSLVAPPEAKISGDLETSTRFGLSTLSGKAAVVSKTISKTHFSWRQCWRQAAELRRSHDGVAICSTIWSPAKEPPRAAVLPERPVHGWSMTYRVRIPLQDTHHKGPADRDDSSHTQRI